MKILFIDVETTGLYPQSASLLEIGAIAYDFKTGNHISCQILLKFHGTMPDEEFFTKFPNHRALINACIKDGLDTKDAWAKWLNFITEVAAGMEDGKITYGGKNPQFDIDFLQQNGFDLGKRHYRMFDVGSYCVEIADDTVIPSLQQCLERFKCDPQVVQHRALQDCYDCINVVAAKSGCPSLDEPEVGNAVGGVVDIIKADQAKIAEENPANGT